MKTTIDAAGRVVVPKKIRDAVQLQAGSELEVRVVDGSVLLRPIAPPVKFERRGHLIVATRPKGAGALTQELVDAARTSIRDERARTPLTGEGRGAIPARGKIRRP